jgi:hypothetical protein
MIKRSTWILLAVFGLAIGAYFYLKAHPFKSSTPATPSPTTSETQFLINTTDEVLSTLNIVDAQGNSVQLERDASGNWTITQPKSSTADQSQAEAAETQLYALKVTTTLETSPSAEVLGLNPAAYTITLVFSSGRQQVLEVGGLTPTNSGYYVRLENKVYVISQTSLDALLQLMQNPPYSATPTP